MVKRRRLGSCSAQDEKRPEEISEIQRDVAGEAPTPVRCTEVATTTTATQQLTRTRSQNAPRVTSPSGVQGSDDGPEKLQQEAKGAMPAQRSSLRVLKRPRKDVSPPPPVSATGAAAAGGAAAGKKATVSKQAGDVGKTRRTWEQWSADDKSSFFEAVCEFGKDFESIQSYIAQRSKKKGVPAHCIKNKDQVRHFYYRTWHKISKVMNIGEGREDVKKQTQELYGLINYAELRKKYSASINEKNGQLLTELVLTGSTVVKIRGKRIRIKTPLCRALKKLNNVEDTKEEEPRKLPVEVCMEFRPRNNSAWVHVQSLAQNPRVRTKASLQRRLSNVLEHLQGRWRPIRARQKEQVLASLSTGGADSAADPEPTWELRVWPVGPVSPVSITAAASSLNVSFECHRKKAVADGVKCRKTKQSKSAKHTATEVPQHDGNPSHMGNMSASADDNATDMKPLDPEREVTTAEDDAAKSLTLLRSMLEPDPVAIEAPDPSPNPNPAPDPPLDPSLNPTTFAMSIPSSVIENAEDLLPECKEEGAEKLTFGELLGLAAEEAREARERAKNGWTASEAGLMTVGELYLMTFPNVLQMGCPTKIVLQYDFCPVEESKEAVTRQCTAMLKKLLSLATVMFAEKSKQGPLSPPAGKSAAAGGGSSGRASGSAGTPPSSKATTGRAIGRSPSSRSVQRPTLQQVQQAQVLENAAESGGSQQHAPGTAGDQHVFVVPMGMAPRTHKQGVGMVPTAGASIAQEQLDKLLPGHRRGHRMRTTRKPLVVQRPLLPRDQRRPVTLVQLLPSAPATITTMLPQPPPTMVEPLPATVKLLHPGPAFEVQTMPILEPTTVAVATHPVAAEVNNAVLATQATSELAAQCTGQLNATSQQELSARVEELAAQTLEPSAGSSTLPSLSPPNISSLLDISLPESMPSDGGPTQLLTDGNALPSFADASGSSLSGLAASLETGSTMEGGNPLSSFVEASDSNLASAFGLACEEVRKASSREDETKTEALTTPPMSPFKLVPSAPDPNWLNGESSDFSLSSLLNTLDSPLKGVQGSGLSTSGAPVLASDNSYAGLHHEAGSRYKHNRPQVDTQLQCLMNENSVDYVAKFADLAAQIASSNSESKS
ncbi:hypothetical protein HPB47_009467 [Ixodes persulcatus]|uniref:Uncharacterized protein n=1 Tax=Ixodes persulcatus TaxID=34615 RepID=A0AC60P1S7_IXOPE|nr:hypothetical protein HPB47_009467 [Ixodes persulcatus]